jgi:hypothetical protein
MGVGVGVGGCGVGVGCGEIWANTVLDAVNTTGIIAAAKTSAIMMWIVSFVFI